MIVRYGNISNRRWRTSTPHISAAQAKQEYNHDLDESLAIYYPEKHVIAMDFTASVKKSSNQQRPLKEVAKINCHEVTHSVIRPNGPEVRVYIDDLWEMRHPSSVGPIIAETIEMTYQSPIPVEGCPMQINEFFVPLSYARMRYDFHEQD